MKKYTLSELLSRFALPAALILLGLSLLVNPDWATVLTARLLGYILMAAAVAFVIAAVTSSYGLAAKVAGALVCFALGSWLLRDPAGLARVLGRIVGAVIAIWGGREVFFSTKGKGQLLSLLVLILGVVLILMPMTASRVVFVLCGVVALIVGVLVLIDRLRDDPRIDGGKPDIIDIP